MPITTALLLFANASPTAAALPAPVAVRTLLRSTCSWSRAPYPPYPRGRPVLTMLKMTIPPRTALPWHYHPVANAAYVLSGSLTIEERDGGRRRTFVAGDAVAESVGVVHRGVSGREATVLLVTYAGVAGTPLTIRAGGARTASRTARGSCSVP